MNREIEINKFNRSITFQNRGIGFSQIGVADEILNLIDDLEQENKQLNSILTELEEWLKEEKKNYHYSDHYRSIVSNIWLHKLIDLKRKYKI